RHDLRTDIRRARHGNRDYHALYLCARVPLVADRQGLSTRRADLAVCRGADRGDDPAGVSPRARRFLMRPKLRTQVPLFLLLCAFTAVNLTPVIWGVLTSIKRPVDAFSVPPTLIFLPTFEFHWQVWVEKAFWHFLI